MQGDENALVERVNAGAQVPQVEPSHIEAFWDVMNEIPRERRQTTAIGLGAVARCANPALDPPNAEQRVALMFRLLLLDALVERGVLEGYMSDDSLRKKVFAAAASIPCDKNDLGEALALKALRESQPEVAEKTSAEMRQAGYGPNHPKVDIKFIGWMRDNC